LGKNWTKSKVGNDRLIIFEEINLNMNTLNKTYFSETQISGLQYATLFVCFLMNMLDGMDVLVISFAAPAIAKAWDISPATLGIVFSSSLTGMTIGAILLAPLADKIGRKTLVLISALIMGVCIYVTSYAENVTHLIIIRFLSGLGIGCMLATTATLAAEFSPSKTRDYWVSLVISGYPIGAVVSGLVSAQMIPLYGWQSIFQLAGVAGLICLPIIYFFMNESLDFYVKAQPKNALEKLNRVLNKLGQTPEKQLPEKSVKTQINAISSLLEEQYRKPTIQLWVALFAAFASLYFLTSWIPKLATTAGLSLKLAIYAGTVFNVGAFFGIITQGYFSGIYGLKKTIGVFFIGTAILLACFGLFTGSDWILLVLALLGFGIQGGFVGLYAVSARMYPTHFRATGIGYAMGAGRVGGIVGPIAAGFFISAGFTMSSLFMIFAVPALIAGLLTYFLKLQEAVK
jgi:MFS transporter, AAHS family, 4-hydroxybenzoate transporter